MTEGRYPSEMRQAIGEYVDFVREFPGQLLVEQRVEFTDWVPGGFGTADALVLNGDHATLIDLKYGKGVQVSAEDNPQLKLYALGVLQTHDWLYGIKQFTLVIHQPRLDHISTFDISTADLLEWGESAVKPAAVLALTDDAPCHPGETQCRFCKAKAICKARADANLAVAYEEFGALPGGDTLTSDQLSAVLHKLGEVERWAKDVKAHAQQQALDGHSIPGWKLVEGRSLRKWADEAEVAKAFRKLKFKKAEYTIEKMIGVPDAEKLLGGKKEAAPILESLIVRPEGKPTLVPNADKRREIPVKQSAADDFAE